MLRAHVRSASMEAAADVQQAAEIAADHTIGAGRCDGVHLAREHRARNVGVLHRKQPAEPAALLLIADVNRRGAVDRRDQFFRLTIDAETAEEVARGVIGHFARDDPEVLEGSKAAIHVPQ